MRSGTRTHCNTLKQQPRGCLLARFTGASRQGIHNAVLRRARNEHARRSRYAIVHLTASGVKYSMKTNSSHYMISVSVHLTLVWKRFVKQRHSKNYIIQCLNTFVIGGGSGAASTASRTEYKYMPESYHNR